MKDNGLPEDEKGMFFFSFTTVTICYEDEEQTRQIYTMFPGGFFDGIPNYASLCQECSEGEDK